MLKTPVDVGEDTNKKDTESSTYTAELGSDITSGLGAFGFGPRFGSSQTFPVDDSTIRTQLYQVYFQQVHPIVRILHGPSQVKPLQNGEWDSLGENTPRQASVEALSATVLYSAVNSMTETQCSVIFQDEKSRIVAQYRTRSEAALANAGLVATRDMTVLQAFVLYLVGATPELEDSHRQVNGYSSS